MTFSETERFARNIKFFVTADCFCLKICHFMPDAADIPETVSDNVHVISGQRIHRF